MERAPGGSRWGSATHGAWKRRYLSYVGGWWMSNAIDGRQFTGGEVVLRPLRRRAELEPPRFPDQLGDPAPGLLHPWLQPGVGLLPWLGELSVVLRGAIPVALRLVELRHAEIGERLPVTDPSHAPEPFTGSRPPLVMGQCGVVHARPVEGIGHRDIGAIITGDEAGTRPPELRQALGQGGAFHREHLAAGLGAQGGHDAAERVPRASLEFGEKELRTVRIAGRHRSEE